MKSVCAALLSLVLAAAGSAHAQEVAKVEVSPPGLAPLPSAVSGRVEAQADGGVLRQWPGTYFETAFIGPDAYFQVGPGAVSLRVRVDGAAPLSLVKPPPGLYQLSGLAPAGSHQLRIDVASESQAGPTSFGGFFAGAGARPAPLPHRSRMIEFIGDSHTVGYGDTSATRRCDEDRIWATTDTSQGLAPRTAAHYDADYEVNAISGRGVVRNYNGVAADTLPTAYPFVLFDKAQVASEAAWRPQVIVIALGTNDFSTPLNPGEAWRTRGQLHADFEATYVQFIARLRARDPHAYIVLWATDFGGGEIQAEVAKVVAAVRRSGDERVGFVPVSGLAFSACNFHPGLADDQKIADALVKYIDAQQDVWNPSEKGTP